MFRRPSLGHHQDQMYPLYRWSSCKSNPCACRGLSDELKGRGAHELSVTVVALHDQNSHFSPSSAEEMVRVYNFRSQHKERIEVLV